MAKQFADERQLRWGGRGDEVGGNHADGPALAQARRAQLIGVELVDQVGDAAPLAGRGDVDGVCVHAITAMAATISMWRSTRCRSRSTSEHVATVETWGVIE